MLYQLSYFRNNILFFYRIRCSVTSLPRLVSISFLGKTILRRASQFTAQEDASVFKVRDLEVNIINRSVVLGNEEIRLTAKEFDLLQLFLNHRGKVFTREEMLDAVWKNDYSGDARTVDVHIRRLREKIERNPTQPEFIFTKWGVGYYFTDRDE